MEVATFHPLLFISGLSNVDVIIWINLLFIALKRLNCANVFFSYFSNLKT